MQYRKTGMEDKTRKPLAHGYWLPQIHSSVEFLSEPWSNPGCQHTVPPCIVLLNRARGFVANSYTKHTLTSGKGTAVSLVSKPRFKLMQVRRKRFIEHPGVSALDVAADAPRAFSPVSHLYTPWSKSTTASGAICECTASFFPLVCDTSNLLSVLLDALSGVKRTRAWHY